MPRDTRRTTPGIIIIPKDLSKLAYKIIITDSDGTEHDVTDYMINASVTKNATIGISGFVLNLDNNLGRYLDYFTSGNIVDIWWGYSSKDDLSTHKFRGYIDSVYDTLSFDSGSTLLIEGRDCPPSEANEHFTDTKVTLQFTGRNNLDCWAGVSGDSDELGNKSDGVLYNSGMSLKIYDTSTESWKEYNSLSSSQKSSLKAISGYTTTHFKNYVDQSRLNISKGLAEEGDYDFRVKYDYDDDSTFLMVHPENAIINKEDYAAAAVNMISMSKYGANTTGEFNRIKQKGKTDGNIILIRTKSDTTRQQALWIKDKVESNTTSTTDQEVSDTATARLNVLKTAIPQGACTVIGIESLEPGEKIPLVIPYIMNNYVKVKSMTITLQQNLSFSLNLQERETDFAKLFKDRYDETVSITPTDNPNGMRDSLVFDFTDEDDYTLVKSKIVDETLTLDDGESTGTCTTVLHTADENIEYVELRVKGSQMLNCTYQVTNNGGITYFTITPGSLLTMTTTGKELILKVTLNLSDTSGNPEFNKINLLYK